MSRTRTEVPPDSSADGEVRAGSPWRLLAWAAAALVLLVPLAAMLVTDEVRWSVGDFALLGGLILGVGLPLELAVRRQMDVAHRWAAGLALVTAFLIVVVNGAVGIIGSEDNNVNLLFGGVLAIAFVGALVARFRPRGMARAMGAAALAQAAIAVGALVAGLTPPASERVEIVALWVFVALWAASALLFERAADREPATNSHLEA